MDNNILRKARPTLVLHCVVKLGGEIHIRFGKMTDYGSLFNNISKEGYDNGPNGPTYWRIGSNHHWYSTITRDGEFYLIITELDPDVAEDMRVCGEMAVSKLSSIYPPDEELFSVVVEMDGTPKALFNANPYPVDTQADLGSAVSATGLSEEA